MADFKDLSPLLDPQSIAIVGASPKESSWPARIRANLLRFNFPGRIYPVNPRYESLWGQKCYATLDALPEVVDNAVFIVSAPRVIDLIQQSRQPKFRTALVLSGGFGEGNDEEGLKRKEFLERYAREKNIRICGPNCMGLVSTRSRAAIFPDQRLNDLQKGGLAVVSQSGGLLGALTRAIFSHGMGLSYFVSSGNEIEADLSDYLHHFLQDKETKVLAAIVEGVKEAEKFISVAREAQAKAKPILILKVGRSPKGIDAALAHTGALAGSDQVFEAVCIKNGIIRVGDLDELLNTAELFLRTNSLPAGKKAAFATLSGGLRVLVSDLAYEVGLELPELHSRTEAELTNLLGVGTSIGNPLDIGGLTNQETFLNCVNKLLADPRVDMLATQEELPQSNARPDKESNLMALAHIADKSPKPIAVFSMSTLGINDYGRQFKKRCRLPFLEVTHNTVRALKHLGFFSEAVNKHKERMFEQRKTSKTIGPKARGLLTAKKVLTEWESYRVIEEFGLPLAKALLAADVDEAARAADEIGYPVVVKLLAPGMTHKTEMGAVRLNLRSPEEIKLACQEIESVFRKVNPKVKPDGFLVQEMVCGGVETIIGTVHDSQFGPAVMFGLGGQYVELYRDVVFRLAPVTAEEAGEMIQGIKGFPMLAGFRGNPPLDIESLSKAIVAISELAVAGKEWIQSIDLNPFISLKENGKAVDAVIVTKQS